jgi:hydrogenase maturation protease
MEVHREEGAVVACRTLVLGVGNVLMGDEGVGVHAVRRLSEEPLPEDVTALDGGTGGFHLLECLCGHDSVVLIDATMDGQPVGTVTTLEPRYSTDYPKTLSAHDIGLKDLIESAALIGRLPRVRLVTVSVAEMQPMQLSLSREVEGAIPEVLDRIEEMLAEEAALTAAAHSEEKAPEPARAR